LQAPDSVNRCGQITKWTIFSEHKIELKLQDHYGNVKRKVHTWHGQLIMVSCLVMKFKDDIFLHEAGESNDGLRRHFPPLIIILQATADVPASSPAEKTMIPAPAPAAVARMGASPNKRNPNTNLASLPSMIFSLC